MAQFNQHGSIRCAVAGEAGFAVVGFAVVGFAVVGGGHLRPEGVSVTERYSRGRLAFLVLGVIAGIASGTATLYAVILQENAGGMHSGDDWIQEIVYFVVGVALREEVIKLAFFAVLTPFLLRRDDALTAFLTAFYTFRMVLLTFHGSYKGHAHPHESPRVMTVPLMILAIGAIAGGFVLIPGVFSGFHHWVEVRQVLTPEEVEAGFDWAALIPGLIAAVGGVVAAWFVYSPDADTQEERDRVSVPGLYPLLRALLPLRDGLLGPLQRFCFENDAADEDLGPDHWFWDEWASGGIFVELMADPSAGIAAGEPAFFVEASFLDARTEMRRTLQRRVVNALAPGENPSALWPSFSDEEHAKPLPPCLDRRSHAGRPGADDGEVEFVHRSASRAPC